MSATPLIVHSAWCDPEQHEHGRLDWWCRSSVQAFIAHSSAGDDLDGIEVQVERYGARDGAHQAQVRVVTIREGASNLTPAETREAARLMLAAADIAEGLAVKW